MVTTFYHVFFNRRLTKTKMSLMELGTLSCHDQVKTLRRWTIINRKTTCPAMPQPQEDNISPQAVTSLLDTFTSNRVEEPGLTTAG